jgi:tetratricopeptide (TPR) repeat protein
MSRGFISTTANAILGLVLVMSAMLSSDEGLAQNRENALQKGLAQSESAIKDAPAKPSDKNGMTAERALQDAQQKADKACSRPDLEAVLASYQEALKLLEPDGNRSRVADVFLQLGRFNVYLARYPEAEAFLDKALGLYTALGEQNGKIKVLAVQVVFTVQKEQLRQAVDSLEHLLRACGGNGHVKNQAQCLAYVAAISEECSAFRQAEECSSRKHDAGLQRDATADGIRFMSQTGKLLRQSGMHDLAEQIGERSLGIARGLQNPRGEASALADLAHVYQDRGQYDRAFVRYLKALSIHETLNDPPNQTQVMNNLGRVLLVQGKSEEARSFHEKALNIARANGDLKGETVSLGGLGSVYQATGEYAKAAECHEKSLEIIRKTGNVRGEPYTLDHLGTIHLNHGAYAKAAECFEQSLVIRRKIGHRKGEATSLSRLGAVYQSWGQQDKALKYLEESLDISRKIGDVRGEATSLNQLGEVYRAWGQFDKALEYFEKSVDIARKIGDAKAEAASLNNLGNVHRAWGQYDKALECYDKSLRITRKTGDVKGEAASLNNLGRVHQSWGQYDKALKCFEKSLAITRKIGDAKGEAASLKSMGIVSVALGSHEEAERYYEQALEIEKKLGLSASTTNALMAQLHMDRGDVHKAETFVREANKPIPTARLLLLKSDFPGARKVYEQLLTKAEKGQHWANLFVAHTGLGMAMEGLGEHAAAADHFRRAIKLTEKERDRLASGDRESYFDVKIRGISRTAPYEGMARVLVKTNQHDRAFRISELAKARTFAEAIARKPSRMPLDVPAEVQAKSRELADRAAELESRREKAVQFGDKELLEYLQTQITQIERDIRAYRKSLQERFPIYAATRYPTRALPLKESAVREDEWILSYDATDSGLLIYLVHGRQIVRAVFKPVRKLAVEELVRKFRTPLVLEGSDTYQQKMEKLRSFDFAAGKELTDLLLEDILSDLPPHVPVVIIPDDSLADLPFEMLVLNNSGRIEEKNSIPCTMDASFFGDRNPVSYYQSVTALTLTRTFGTHSIPGNKLLVIADPVTDPYDERVTPEALSKVATAKEPAGPVDSTISLLSGQSELLPVRLPQTKDLAEHLANINSTSELLMGFDASKQKFLGDVGPRLAEFKHIVFATHGSYGSSERGIKEPVLCLTLIPQGTDGLLRMSEVLGLKLNADLVALTACQSGLGKKVPGEGIMGMGRAFQYAGARSVLMSLWSVQATASTRLVETFYRKLMEGRDKLDALTLARNEIRQNGFDHPFFWAGLILTGERD